MTFFFYYYRNKNLLINININIVGFDLNVAVLCTEYGKHIRITAVAAFVLTLVII